MKKRTFFSLFAAMFLLCICFAATACQTEEYTLTFANTGDTVVKDQIVKLSKKAVKPVNPTSQGFDFGGWYSDIDYTLAFNFDVDKITEDTILYAKWIPKPDTKLQFTITYNYQEGAGEGQTSEVTFGSTYTFNVPTRSGFDFIGWYSKPNGEGIKYTSIDGIGLSKWSGTSNTTIYAYWYDINNEPYGYGEGKKKAPDFTVYTLDGQEVKLSKYWGEKPVFVSLWSTG